MLREPNDIASYAALACIAIQSNQNDQHGGQSVCDFDYGLGDGVRKTYRRLYKKHLAEALDLLADLDDPREAAQSLLARVEAETGTVASLTMDAAFAQGVARELGSVLEAGRAHEGETSEAATDAAAAAAPAAAAPSDTVRRIMAYAEKNATADTDRATFQAMEARVHLSLIHISRWWWRTLAACGLPPTSWSLALPCWRCCARLAPRRISGGAF